MQVVYKTRTAKGEIVLSTSLSAIVIQRCTSKEDGSRWIFLMRDGISTFVSLKPMDIFNRSSSVSFVVIQSLFCSNILDSMCVCVYCSKYYINIILYQVHQSVNMFFKLHFLLVSPIFIYDLANESTTHVHNRPFL